MSTSAMGQIGKELCEVARPNHVGGDTLDPVEHDDLEPPAPSIVGRIAKRGRERRRERT